MVAPDAGPQSLPKVQVKATVPVSGFALGFTVCVTEPVAVQVEANGGKLPSQAVETTFPTIGPAQVYVTPPASVTANLTMLPRCVAV